jgi:hypothetical protein
MNPPHQETGTLLWHVLQQLLCQGDFSAGTALEVLARTALREAGKCPTLGARRSHELEEGGAGTLLIAVAWQGFESGGGVAQAPR